MNWHNKPRNISVLVDNESWILPYARQLVEAACDDGDDARLCRDYDEMATDGIAFYLGCLTITPPEILVKNPVNLVVHASDLPKGRGMSPWTWLVLEGADRLPVCLLKAAEKVDEGDILYKDFVDLQGTELVDDLRDIIGKKTLELCLRFLREDDMPAGQPQSGEASYYKRRTPKDSELDISKPLIDQINLLRVVDNEAYPAFFDYKDQRYVLKIEKKKDE